MTAGDLLSELDPWLARRCRYTALRVPGLDAEEIYQRAVEEFLRKIERWLQQDATVSPVAQAKTLLTLCIRHVQTAEWRERAQREPIPETEDGDGLDRLAPPVEPSDDLAAGELLGRIRESTTPPCSLCLLSLRLPGAVEMGDADRAKAWKKGGANAVPRPVPDAWAIFETGRAQPVLVSEEGGWKEHVGVAWYTEGAVTSITPEERRSAAGKVERYANRGADDLRAALLGAGEPP